MTTEPERTTEAQKWLSSAASNIDRNDTGGAIACALVGLLSAVTEIVHTAAQEDFLRGKWDECDAALGRVLDVASDLDGHPHATLKPTAFSDLAQRIRAAIDGEVWA